MSSAILDLAAKSGIFLKRIISINELGLDFQAAIGEDVEGTKWILRIPRRNDIFSQIQKEQSHLSFLKSRVSFNIPIWKVSSPELVAYPLLTNKPALEVDPETQEFNWNIDLNSYEYSESLGSVLFELHSLTDEAKESGVEALTPENIRKNFLDEISMVQTQLGLSTKLEKQWKKWVEEDSYWPTFTSLIHGDLYAGHTLVNSFGRITGVIDWSEMQIADSSTDFVGQYVALGEPQLEKLLSVYEMAGGRTWPRMKEHIVNRASASPLKFAVFALNTKNDQHILAAKEQLNSD